MGAGFGHPRYESRPAVDWAGARIAVELVSGKWVLPVMAVLASGPRRHGDLFRAVGQGVSEKMLTETLRRMEATGLVVRRLLRGEATAVVYALTPLARSLEGPLAAMARWTDEHRDDLGSRSRPGPSRA